MKTYILIREFILDNGEVIAAIVATVTLGTLFGTILGFYIANDLYLGGAL